MKTRIGKLFTFSSAHFLPQTADDHPCRKLHGHNYRVELVFEGECDAEKGWLIDYREIKKTWRSDIKQQIDHVVLNDVEGLENPTAECVASWILNRWNDSRLITVKVWETDTCWAEASRTP